MTTLMRASKLNSTDHLWVFDVCVRCALIILGQTFLCFFFFSFLFFVQLQVWERLDQDEAPPIPHKRICVNTCGRRLLQLPRRSLWISSYSRCYLSVTSARATAEPDFPRLCEWAALRLRNFGSPWTILSPEKQKEAGDGNETTVGRFQTQSTKAK